MIRHKMLTPSHIQRLRVVSRSGITTVRPTLIFCFVEPLYGFSFFLQPKASSLRNSHVQTFMCHFSQSNLKYKSPSSIKLFLIPSILIRSYRIAESQSFCWVPLSLNNIRDPARNPRESAQLQFFQKTARRDPAQVI
jgi:hypothetical protein